MQSQFVKELTQSLEDLVKRCHVEANRSKDMSNKIILETAAEVMTGLGKALSENYINELTVNEESHYYSPKSNEPWD